MKVFLYTIPKAGTYLLADFIGRIGYRNSGYHVERYAYLDTFSIDAKTNREYPGAAQVKTPAFEVLGALKDRDLAFGHFMAPAFPDVLHDFSFVCAYRHPKETLVSEFIDFRFRRKGIVWASKAAIPDDQLAFETYLETHGPIQRDIHSKMLDIQACVRDPGLPLYEEDRYFFLNFDDLRARPDDMAKRLGSFLGYEGSDCAARLAQSFDAETKTKATDLALDRAGFWSDRAIEIYRAIGFEHTVHRACDLGWTFQRPEPAAPAIRQSWWRRTFTKPAGPRR